MIITSHISENAFGDAVTYKLYRPVIPSGNYLLFFHGVGEVGPIDGSELFEVERNGYPEHAKKGFEFPFNIVAVQAQSSYAQIRKFLPAYIQLKYKADVIIATGLSMGGYCTFDIGKYDYLRIVYAIAPVCGGANKADAAAYPNLPAWAFHGDKDTVVPFSRSKAFVDEYNKTHEIKFKYTLYPGVDHNAWDKAYATDGELLQWLIQKFEEAPKRTDSRFLRAKDFINSL